MFLDDGKIVSIESRFLPNLRLDMEKCLSYGYDEEIFSTSGDVVEVKHHKVDRARITKEEKILSVIFVS
jgi:hypothetical protein